MTYSQALDYGRPGRRLRLAHRLSDRLVYRRLRAALGGRVGYAISGGAPLGVRLGHFLRGIGITVLEGYGLVRRGGRRSCRRAVARRRPQDLRVRPSDPAGRMALEDRTADLAAGGDPFIDESEIRSRQVRPASFDDLMEGADYLVIQSSLTPQTHHTFDRATLRRMKPTAILINTARGSILEDTAIHQALTEGWVAGAALDDLEEEPAKQRDWRPRNPLLSCPI
ncbi:NAD(P)-dependent oxidoreductase [Microbispora rosea]|uniref:NAD(P)-dependent oxidoreductase n=1 Tax=Microbispora rosea TaxID=58117 RepID=UPI0034260FFD